eukprot:14934274-Alexandrium_andersonii.AAC.1
MRGRPNCSTTEKPNLRTPWELLMFRALAFRDIGLMPAFGLMPAPSPHLLRSRACQAFSEPRLALLLGKFPGPL